METDPVAVQHFFGRGDILELLNKRFDAFEHGYRQNIGLVGEPWTGKSSILTQFLRTHPFKQTIPILVRLEETDSFQTFSQKWLASVLYGYERFLGLHPTGNLKVLIKQMNKRIPRTIKQMRAIRKLTDARQFDSSYREHLNLLSVFREETGKKILLVMDEYHRLIHLPLSDPFAQLGKEIMIQKDTMYVVASSEPERARDIFREKLSLLFANFEIVEVRHFTFEEAENWMSARLGGALQDRALRKITLRLTNGHPFYLDVLIKRFEILLALKGVSEVTPAVFIQALEEELFNDQGVLHQHFVMKIFSVTKNRFSFTHGDVLLALALGKKKTAAVTKFLGKSTDEVKKIIQRLVRDRFVEKHGSLWDVTDSLFRFWLSEVYYRKRALFDLDATGTQAAFRRSVELLLQFFAREDAKDLARRIEELFKRFGNDVIELRSKKIKCPRFQEIVSKPTNGRMFPVVAKGQHSRWMCQVVRERAKEEDVRLFVEDLGRLRSKVHKKIIIALRGIELNAKLLAQESKIQLWDLRDLNAILDLYGHPKVIL